MLAIHAPDVAEKTAPAYERLRAGASDPEAISQAMNTCRRMLSTMANAVRPPGDPEIDDTGVPHRMTKSEYKNRLVSFVKARAGQSRAERIAKFIDVLHDRVSGALKAETASPDAAEPLFLHTYMILGEIASLNGGPTPE